MANETRKTFVPNEDSAEKHSLRPMNTTPPTKTPDAPKTPPPADGAQPAGPQEKK